MRSFWTLLLALILSGLVAGAVLIQLGIIFKAELELVFAMVALAVATPATTVVLGITRAASGKVATIDRVGLWLIGLTVLAAVALLVFDAVASRAVTRAGVMVITEITVPLLIMIAIQWWLVRRRAEPTHSA